MKFLLTRLRYSNFCTVWRFRVHKKRRGGGGDGCSGT